MTGQFIVCSAAAEIAKHTHAIVKLASGRELRFVAPVRGWIVAAWARTLAPKKRHRFQKLLLRERGRQFVGDKGLVELATLRPMLPDIV